MALDGRLPRNGAGIRSNYCREHRGIENGAFLRNSRTLHPPSLLRHPFNLLRDGIAARRPELCHSSRLGEACLMGYRPLCAELTGAGQTGELPAAGVHSRSAGSRE